MSHKPRSWDRQHEPSRFELNYDETMRRRAQQLARMYTPRGSRLRALLGRRVRWWVPVLAIAAAWALALLTGCGMPPTVVARGELVAVERNETYEPICGFLSRYISHCGDAPRAYEAVVVADTAWPRFNPKTPKQHFMFFAPAGNAIPAIGWFATWILHRRELKRLSTCTLYGCQSEVGHALDSDADVRSYHEFSRVVDSLRQAPR